MGVYKRESTQYYHNVVCLIISLCILSLSLSQCILGICKEDTHSHIIKFWIYLNIGSSLLAKIFQILL